jgi:soluble lytic murein transglycosylase-like protein
VTDAVTYRDGNLILFTLAVAAGAAAVMVGTTYLKTPYDDIFNEAARAKKLDPDLLRAIAQKESSMNPRAIGDAGKSFGLMQIWKDTAKRYGVTDTDTLFQPYNNITIASRILSDNVAHLGNNYSIDNLIASYNAGPDLIPYPHSYVAAVKQHYYLFKIGRELNA